MRLVSVKEALGYGSGEVIPSIKGRLSEVWPRKSGTNANGEWSIQNLTIKDDGGELKLMVTGRDEIPKTHKGRLVYLSCKEGDKGMTGLKVEDEEYRGKTTRKLKVTPSASVDFLDGNGTQPQTSDNDVGNVEPPQQPPPAPQPQAKPTNGNGHSNGNGNGGDENPVSQAALRRCQDYWRVMDRVHTMRLKWDERHPEHRLSPEHFQAAVSTVYIQLQRDGVINGNH